MYKLYAVLVAMLLVHNAYTQACNLQLTGHVMDSAIGGSLAYATVRLVEVEQSIITDIKGNFEFTALCPKVYTLVISHVNCATYTQSITLTKSVHVDVDMPHTYNTQGQAVVIGTKERFNTGFKKELSGAALQATSGTSLAQALSTINGITLLQTGTNVAKPILHGLSGNRLLIINNGVRLEGQQWGNEHAPEVDPFMADKLVVIKGVDELKYGSDAIGGAILVEPKSLQKIACKTLQINTGYFTNNMQYYTNAIWEARLLKKPQLSYRIQATYKQGANSTTPNYRLNNTGLTEANYSIAARLDKTNWNTELFYSSFYTTLGIFAGSHIGNITDLTNAIQAKQPNPTFTGQSTYNITRPRQQVQHHTIKWKSVITLPKSKLNTLVALQINQRDEYDVVRNSTNKKPQIQLNINTLNQDVNWEKKLTPYSNTTLGIAATQQQNTYTGRYLIPNYLAYTTGLYGIYKWSKHKWDVQAGLRYDNKVINTTRLRINNNVSSFKFNYNTYALSTNVGYKLTQGYTTNINISHSTRAPYVNELLSDGIHHGTATYERGAITLTPEQSWYASSNHSYTSNNSKLVISALAYVNHIRNFIYQQPKPENPVLTIAGAFPLIQYEQTDATLTGTDVQVQYAILSTLNITTKYAYLRAYNNTTNDWIILMPPTTASTSITYTLPNTSAFTASTIGIEHTLVNTQHRVPTKGPIQDYKEAPQGYNLYNVQAQSQVKLHNIPVHITLSVHNVFNTAYRNYLNAFRYYTDEIGRNVALKLHIPIQF